MENTPHSPAPPVPPAFSLDRLPPPPHAGIAGEERTLGMLCHLLGIFTGFLGPLILWLVKKDDSAFVAHHGREALNFQITLLLAMVCLGSMTFVLIFFVIGIVFVPLLFIVPMLALIAEIMAAIAAQNGEWFRYPCCLRLV